MAEQLLLLLSFSLSAGALTVLSPCGYVMLPSLAAYFMARRAEVGNLMFTVAVIVGGILTIHAVLGVALGFIGVHLLGYSKLLQFVAAAVVIAMGALITFGSSLPPFRTTLSFSPNMLSRPHVYYVFGITYGLTAQACTLPVFLAVSTAALSLNNILYSTAVLLSYGGGALIPLLAALLLSYAGKEYLLRKIGRRTVTLHRVSGVLLIVVGIYLVLYAMGLIYISGSEIIIRPSVFS
jgi:cytochrome c-type biogenesis protein